jgi:hypothetical protein
MDPLSLLMTALVSGAAAGLKPTAAQAVKDAYKGLKALIKQKFQHVTVEILESDPGNAMRQGIVKEDLAKAQAAADEDVLTHAQAVIDAVRVHDAPAAAAVGLSVEQLEAASLTIKNIVAGEGGVDLRLRNVKVAGAIDIEGLNAGAGGQPPIHP